VTSEERKTLDFFLKWLQKKENSLAPSSGDSLRTEFFADSNIVKLLQSEDYRVLDCVFKWIKVREEAGKLASLKAADLEDDALHSSLLERLFRGKEVLLEAPPLNRGYPWHTLIDNGRSVCTAHEAKGEDGTVKLKIEDHLWDITEKVSEYEYVVEFPGHSGTYRVKKSTPSKLSPWEIAREN
jgi:hypothetical protein